MSVYQFWTDSLAGKSPPIINEHPEPGFYRMKRGKAWVPVAVWNRGGTGLLVLGFKFGSDLVTHRDGVEQWPHYAAHPITEEIYRAVAERGENWPDADPTVATMMAPDAPKPAPNATKPPPDATDEMREQIATAVAGIASYAKIEDDTVSARAAGLRNMLLDLKREADRAREREKAPHLAAGKAVDDKWRVLIRDAEAGANRLRTAMENWENDKRAAQREAASRAAVELQAREHEAQHEDISAPPPQPVTVQSNLPAPADQVRPTHGKAASVGTYQHVTAIDVDQVFQMFKTNAEVLALLTRLAQNAINMGTPVPGATSEPRAKIR